ncbi:MAG: putative Ig domain-containing protein [Hormoscilla sp. SP5CHS1]|nr:putative Ig domain-containing protein [Hormoscilla sp. SP5CHS1]
MSANKRLENRPYVVTEISDVEVVVDDGEFSLDVSENFGDINDNINRYNASGLPKGLTINSSSGEISGTSTTDGIFGVTVTVSDTAGGSVEDEFEIEVLFRDDHLHGGTGNDHLYRGSGNDYLYGYTGSDYLYGGTRNDYLYGGTGSDYLYGGTGNDYLYGGTGKDIFVLTPGSGLNVIEDFDDGTDKIKLPEGSTFEDVRLNVIGPGNISWRPSISIGTERLAVLNWIHTSQLDEDDFMVS